MDSNPPPVPPGMDVILKEEDSESQSISKAKADLLDQIKTAMGPQPTFIDVVVFWISPISSVLICSGILLSSTLVAIDQFLGEAEFYLALLVLIPLYIVIIPLVSMTASLMEDYSKLDTLDAITKSITNAAVGSVIFTLFLFGSVIFVAGEDGFDEIIDILDISLQKLFFFAIGINVFSSLLGTSFNVFINSQRGPQ